jgi:hypothetical protein
MEIINHGQWFSGCDSISFSVGQGSYQWSQNTTNRGGIIETHQGFAEIAPIAEQDPRGCTIITINNETLSVAAMCVCNPDCSRVAINR